MLEILDHKKAAAHAYNLLERLTYSGYVGRGTMKRFLRYFFLIDMIDFFYPYITDRDYDHIINVLQKTFGAGDCLLPYPMFCSNRAMMGMPAYMGTAKSRITEVNSQLRITEDSSNLRSV